MGLREEEIIGVLKPIFATTDPRVAVGIGDDGAVVSGSSGQVLTTDMAVEGVHFRTDWSSAFEIGRKITAANLADIYAMGATPRSLLLAMSLTGNEELEWIEDLARGIKYEADLGGAHLVGGDLARADQIILSMTAIGETDNPILRSGAQVGDGIYLSSLTGWSAAGLWILSKNKSAESELRQRALTQYRTPTLDYGYVTDQAHSLSDVSDAVIIQGLQMADASGVCFAFDQDLIAQSLEFNELRELAESIEGDVWQFILAGGEDHAFLATGINLPGIKVGTVQVGNGITGIEMKKAPDLWRHFQ
jgi:thiamine-monophosphate kinase